MENNIKLSKIELEAFRGYKDKVIFDFTLPEGIIADLIAIYAPNGFGKTSFFDGVEWNTKGSVERFEENTKVRNAAREFGGSILKNRESTSAFGTVSLFDDNELYFTRRTSTSGNSDLLAGRIDNASTSPLKNITNYKNFRKIEILPQSRIDSFLSSNSPEEKYQALLDFWDGNDESDYFVGVSKFYEESEKERDKIFDEIDEIGNAISKLAASESKITFLNSLIKEINSKENNSARIVELTESTSDVDFEEIITAINKNVASISSKKQGEESRQERLNALKEDFDIYKKNDKTVLKATDEVKQLQSILNNFILIEAKKEEGKKLDIKLQSEQTDLEEIKLISSLKKDFLDVTNQITFLSDERNSITEAKPTLLEQKNNAEKELKSKSDQFKKLLDNEVKHNENSERLLDLFNAIESNKKRIELSTNRLSLIKRIKEIRNNIASATRAELNIIQNILSYNLESFCASEYPYDEFKETAVEIGIEYRKIGELDNTLKELRADYNKKGNLNENLQKIIDLGRDFISQTETKSCPLCHTPQEDFKFLLLLISNEKEDTLNLSDSFDKIQSLQTEIERRTNGLEEKYKSLITLLQHKAKILADKLNTSSQGILGTEALIHYYSGIDALITSENKKFNTQYDSIQSENDLIKLILEDSNSLKQSLTKSIAKNEEQIKNIKEKITANDQRVEEIRAKMEVFHQNSQYVKINSFLEKKAISHSDYCELGVEKMIMELENSIQKFKDQIAILQSQIIELNKSTQGKNKDEVQKNLTDKRTVLNDSERKISLYKGQYKSIITEDEITTEIINKNLINNKDVLGDIEVIDHKLRELQENIQFIQQNVELNKLKKIKNEKQEEFKALEETTEKFRILKDELSDFLTKKINSVLNQEIINDIYKKIDPHPDFKTIKLETDFDGVRPKLFIKAINDESKDEIDPILYLSSAQVNILSLSIFLAKALQNKDVMVNTIFMDDPIQYLDSINVLSFIDLLRAITTDTSIDRQVVISTHDENFFNLLKKKFDKNYYNSKFIEFESYGILKEV